MGRSVTIVTYHYVRDVESTAFPGIRALPVSLFRQQIALFEQHYSIVDLQDVLAAAESGASLPANPLLLTFDDGYADHYSTVLPILTERGHTALFFPATQPLSEARVLDVNKIQFVLATSIDRKGLAAALGETVESQREAYGLDTLENYWSRFSRASRYDDAETSFIKRMLQKGLPEPLRTRLIEQLFRRHVTEDEAAFAAELYASRAQLGEMRARGMHIGCHGQAHRWLDALPAAEQRRDIETALAWLRQADLVGERWTMCYPYGGTDELVTAMLRSLGCRLGFTVQPSLADLDQDRLRLPRFDANDFADHTTQRVRRPDGCKVTA
jgi:peptidoglycan/xylan/chitin deacetylase (PgdA/CDA1 family)